MPSVVYGPGKKEGTAAELPPRPTSAWECVADKIPAMNEHQRRRTAMLMLRAVSAWRLEDIGQLFELHKGHVCREIERARIELQSLLNESGYDLVPDPPDIQANAPKCQRVVSRFTNEELADLKAASQASGLLISQQIRLWILTALKAESDRDRDPDRDV